MTNFLKTCGLLMLSGTLSIGALTLAQAEDTMKKTDTTQTDTMSHSMGSDMTKTDSMQSDTMKKDSMKHDDKMMKTDK